MELKQETFLSLLIVKGLFCHKTAKVKIVISLFISENVGLALFLLRGKCVCVSERGVCVKEIERGQWGDILAQWVVMLLLGCT